MFFSVDFNLKILVFFILKERILNLNYNIKLKIWKHSGYHFCFNLKYNNLNNQNKWFQWASTNSNNILEPLNNLTVPNTKKIKVQPKKGAEQQIKMIQI